MKREGFILKFSEQSCRWFLIVCAAIILCLDQTAAAQSGRRKSKGNTPPPSQTGAKEPAPAATPPPVATTPDDDDSQVNPASVKIMSVKVLGEIQDSNPYFRTNALDNALKECVRKLKENPQPGFQVTKGERKATFTEAKEQAKKETDTYVLWIGFVTGDDPYGDSIVDYIDYILLTPETSKRVTRGRVKPGQINVMLGRGGVLTVPRTPRRRSPPLSSQMRQGVGEIVARLAHGGWLD